jgi:CelD/BcsL family acetyltransferase involved in cellulose biosynthesis
MPDAVITAWRQLQHSNPDLVSPYFAPEFTRIVASVRPDVEIGVVESDGQVVALFPWQRGNYNIGGPVGEFISDYEALICRPGFTIQPKALLRSCGLVAWDFDHLLGAQTFFCKFHRHNSRSPIIDLSGGYEAYIKARREAGTEQIKKCGNLMRRLEREVGPLRFVTHSPDRARLEQLLAWKTDQYRQNRWRDLFSIPWVRETVQRIHATQTPDFAGMLSLLYAGDRLVAAHFGMRSASVWHYWFPTYDPAFSKYSPGVTLLLKMAESAPALGLKVIDLGCGEHHYKARFMNGFVLTAKGSVELPGVVTAVRHVWRPFPTAYWKVYFWLTKTPLVLVARRVRKVARRVMTSRT